MNLALEILRYLLPLLYATAFALYLLFFVRRNPSSQKPLARFSTAMLCVSVFSHFGYAVLRGVEYGHHPMASLYEILSIVALALAGVYLVIETWRKNKSTGVFVLPFVLCVQIVSAIGIGPTHDINPILKETPFGAHTGFLTIAYAAFFLSAVYGVMYILFHRALRRKEFGLIFERFPSLDVLAKLNRGAVMVGFIAMTLGVAFGMIWASDRVPDFWKDSKVTMTLFSWFVYGFALASHYFFRWPGKRVVIVALAGFGVVVFSTIAVNVFLPGWHHFLR